jgi:hypothetical protein
MNLYFLGSDLLYSRFQYCRYTISVALPFSLLRKPVLLLIPLRLVFTTTYVIMF